MKKIRLLALLLCLTLLFTGCAAASAPKGEAMNNAVANPEAGNGIYNEGEKTENVTGIEENRKLIRTIDIQADTEDLNPLLESVNSSISQLGGYVQSKTSTTAASTPATAPAGSA
jgi:hypothetical protein